ncbi:hypothetical protein EIP91_004898 [Steccherinum ochraceum]|uniref:Uncharacterized protein n=1 Tax=Steccherinum ochraceum TaxID=92696 RepID=A0A4R0R803_9APHY|nr:hypothetical protein EIP91_004898 [Steccherinum ochraceum]
MSVFSEKKGMREAGSQPLLAEKDVHCDKEPDGNISHFMAFKTIYLLFLLYFDGLLSNLVSGCVMSSTDQTSMIDDRDPRIHYFGSWTEESTTNTAVFDGTLHSGLEPASGFELTFTGIQVAVYGTVLIRNNVLPPIIQISIDDGPLVEFNAPSSPMEGDALLLFLSDALSLTSHKVVANVTRTTADAPFLLDYITILPVAPTPSTSFQLSLPTASSSSAFTASSSASGSQLLLSTRSISTASTASSATSDFQSLPPLSLPPIESSTSSAASDTSQVPPTGSPRNDSQGAGGTSPKAGPIAGSVIGGIAIALIALLSFWWWRRRRNGIFCRHSDKTARATAMRDAGSVLADSSASSASTYAGASQTSPHPVPQAHNVSASQVPDPSSSHSASPYLARPKASTSRSLLDTTTAGEYASESSLTTRVTAAHAARVPCGALRSPQYFGDGKRSRRRPNNTIPPTSNGSPMQHSTPPLPQHADSGMRFSIGVQAEWEVPLPPIGAPPAYTVT